MSGNETQRPKNPTKIESRSTDPTRWSDSTDKIERTAAVLVDDFHRQGEHLTRAQLERVVVKRNLSPEDIVNLQSLLNSSGVVVDDDDESESSLSGFPDSEEPTVRPSDPFAWLLREPLLTRDEEISLARRLELGKEAKASASGKPSSDLTTLIARGDEARAKLIVSNLRLVRAWARKFGQAASMDESDLFQEGIIGLMRAVEKFDSRLGVKFSTYAVWWIRQSISRALADQDRTIRLPVHQVEKIRRLRRVKRLLAYESGRDPTLHELSEAMDVDLSHTAFLQSLAEELFVSIDKPLKDQEEATLSDVLSSDLPSPYELTSEAEIQAIIRNTLKLLSPRDAEVLARRYGIDNADLDETLEEIGVDLGVTRERIRQIQEKALVKVKPLLEMQELTVSDKSDGGTQKKNRPQKNARADKPKKRR